MHRVRSINQYAQCTFFIDGLIKSPISIPLITLHCERFLILCTNCTISDVHRYFFLSQCCNGALVFLIAGCDANCAKVIGSCDVQKTSRCDALCAPGYVLTKAFTCSGINYAIHIGLLAPKRCSYLNWTSLITAKCVHPPEAMTPTFLVPLFLLLLLPSILFPSPSLSLPFPPYFFLSKSHLLSLAVR